VASVEWVPSDEADVFRLTFSSGLGPRYLKLPIEGIGAVWREVALLPTLHALGFPVLDLEHRTTDLPDTGVEFHVTREAEHVPGAELVAGDPPAAHRLASELGRVVRRLEGLDARAIPASREWDRGPSAWWRPEYRALIQDGRWPATARRWAERILERLDTPATAFGGWFGEMLIARDGSFVMIDWTTAGASWACAQAAIGMKVLAGLGGDHRRGLLRHFLRGYAPDGLEPAELDELRLWAVHGSLGWAVLQRPSAEGIRAATRRMQRCLVSDDPADWF